MRFTPDHTKATEIFQRLAIYINTSGSGSPWLKVYRGKQSKPFVNYTFRSMESLEKYLADVKAQEISSIQYMENKKAARKETICRLQPGDILHYSWGWEQTNAEFYQVTRVTSKGAYIREIAHEGIPGTEGFMCQSVKPCPGQFIGEEEFHRVCSAWGTTAPGTALNMKYGAATKVSADHKAYSSWYA